LYLLVLVPAVVMLVTAGVVDADAFVPVILAVCGSLMLLVTAAFRYLTVRDEREHLLIQFGPLPLFHRRLAYSEIEHAVRSRTTFLDGWGIHMSPRGGWTWNLWGYDCVDVELSGGRKIHIGTDDPDGLATFLQSRINIRR
jgi:hypothetical protein